MCIRDSPDIISRGFIEPTETKDKDMIEKSRDLVARALDHSGSRPADWGFIYSKVRDILNKFYYEQTKRHPMIFPVMAKV